MVVLDDAIDLGLAPLHEFVEADDLEAWLEVGLDEVQGHTEGGVDDGGVEEGIGIDDFFIVSHEGSCHFAGGVSHQMIDNLLIGKVADPDVGLLLFLLAHCC